MAATRLTKEEIAVHMDNLSREPFKEILVIALANSPTSSSVADLAKKSPDRYAQYLTQIAKLSGFNDKLEVQHTLTDYRSMCMAELRQLMQSLHEQLTAIDVTPQQIKVIDDHVL